MHLIRATWALAGLTYYLHSTFGTHLELGDRGADFFSSLLVGLLGRAEAEVSAKKKSS